MLQLKTSRLTSTQQKINAKVNCFSRSSSPPKPRRNSMRVTCLRAINFHDRRWLKVARAIGAFKVRKVKRSIYLTAFLKPIIYQIDK
jgi:hypothetical protein